MKKKLHVQARYIKKHQTVLLVFLIIFLIFGEFITRFNLLWGVLKNSAQGDKYTYSKEIQAIKRSNNISEKKYWYLQLIKRVGPIEAQDVLYHAGLPFTGGTHLLNHTIGEFLYEQYGPKGIIYCRDYFSSSCYHGIIINSLAQGKFDTVNVMLDACRKIGKGALNQCTHGLGHGLLAYIGYKNLPDALILCDKVGKGVNGFSYYNCYNGVFMENIWGVHEGKPSPDRWTDAKDYHYPCNEPRIENKYLQACWYNQNSLLLTYYHGDVSKVAKECNSLDPSFKKQCFEGLFNSIQGSSKGDVGKQFVFCKLMPGEWERECLFSQISVEIARGGLDSPFEICARMADLNKNRCYHTIQAAANYYLDSSQKGEVCHMTPEKFKQITCKLTDKLN